MVSLLDSFSRCPECKVEMVLGQIGKWCRWWRAEVGWIKRWFTGIVLGSKYLNCHRCSMCGVLRTEIDLGDYRSDTERISGPLIRCTTCDRCGNPRYFGYLGSPHGMYWWKHGTVEHWTANGTDINRDTFRPLPAMWCPKCKDVIAYEKRWYYSAPEDKSEEKGADMKGDRSL